MIHNVGRSASPAAILPSTWFCMTLIPSQSKQTASSGPLARLSASSFLASSRPIAAQEAVSSRADESTRVRHGRSRSTSYLDAGERRVRRDSGLRNEIEGSCSGALGGGDLELRNRASGEHAGRKVVLELRLWERWPEAG